MIIRCTFVKRGRKNGRKNICLLGREEERRRGQPGQQNQARLGDLDEKKRPDAGEI